VENVGGRGGWCVPQVYVQFPDEGYVPQLRGFEKVFLSPGGTATVKVDLEGGLGVWNEQERTFRQTTGEFKAFVSLKGADLEGAVTVVKEFAV